MKASLHLLSFDLGPSLLRDEGVHGLDMPDLSATSASIPDLSGAARLAASVEEAIVRFIEGKGGVYRIEDVVAEFGNPAKGYSQDYLEELRHLIDDGVVPPPGGKITEY